MKWLTCVHYLQNKGLVIRKNSIYWQICHFNNNELQILVFFPDVLTSSCTCCPVSHWPSQNWYWYQSDVDWSQNWYWYQSDVDWNHNWYWYQRNVIDSDGNFPTQDAAAMETARLLSDHSLDTIRLWLVQGCLLRMGEDVGAEKNGCCLWGDNNITRTSLMYLWFHCQDHPREARVVSSVCPEPRNVQFDPTTFAVYCVHRWKF